MPIEDTVLNQTQTPAFWDVLYGRRSIRSYKADRLSELFVRLLLEAAVHAPTAMHQEPWEFVIVEDTALLQRLSDAAKRRAITDAAHHGRLLKRHGDAGDGIPSPLADPEFNIFYNAGTLIVVCATPANPFVVADCWLAAENLMLAAHALGAGTCCIGFAVAELNQAATKVELGIPADREVVAAIIGGLPADDLPLNPRKPPVVLNWIRPRDG